MYSNRKQSEFFTSVNYIQITYKFAQIENIQPERKIWVYSETFLPSLVWGGPGGAEGQTAGELWRREPGADRSL